MRTALMSVPGANETVATRPLWQATTKTADKTRQCCSCCSSGIGGNGDCKYKRLGETWRNLEKLGETLRNFAKLWRNFAKLCETWRNSGETRRNLAKLRNL